MKFRYDKNTEELVVSSSTRIEYHQMNLWLTRHIKGYRYMPAFKMGVWNGQQTYFKNGRVNIGLWKECYRGCQEIGASFILENKVKVSDPLFGETIISEQLNNLILSEKLKSSR